MRRLALLVPLLVCATPATALASPWTLPRGDVVVGAGFDYQLATTEFFESGGERDFPLNGQFFATTYRLGARAGFTDRLELELGLPIRLVTYESDPVILLPRQATAGDGLDYYQENIIDLGRTKAGIADITFAARYRLWLRPIATALELRIQTPTGYDPPAGTFGERPTSREDFVRNAATYVSPANVQDDVTLGDGVLEISPRLLLGYSFRSGTFLRLDAGYNWRFGGAANQVLGAFKVGQLLAGRLLLYAEARGVYSVQDGEIIGISVAAEDPSLPASEYVGTTNLLLREVRRKRDAVDVGGGAILRIGDDVELNLGYARTVWGRNTAAINTLYAAIGFRASTIGEP